MNYFRKIIYFALPYKKFAFLNIFFNILYAIFSALSFLALIPMLDVLFNTTKVVYEVPKYDGIINLKEFLINSLNYYISESVLSNPEEALLIAISLIILLFFLKNLFNYLALFFITFLRNGILKDLREKLYEKSIKQSISFYSKKKKGDILSRITSDVLEIQHSFLSILELLIREPLTILFTLIVMFSININLTFFVIIFIPVSGLIISWIGKALKKFSLNVQKEQGEFLSILEETLTGLNIIKIFNAEESFIKKFNSSLNNFFKFSNKLLNRQNIASPVSEFLGIVVIGCLLWYGGKMVLINDSLNATTFISFMALAYNILTPAKSISKSYYSLKKGDAAAERVIEILESENAIEDTPYSTNINKFKSEINFKNIDFSYSRNFYLKDFSLEIKKGKSIALVGSSGSGKTTLVNLINRFYDTDSGKILIDNIEIKNIKLKSLRSLIGMVTQESILFNDTIKNNILIGDPAASEETLIKAAKIANAHDFIDSLPEKYLTNIGDGGNKLSGGQKQRLAIARAIIKNPPILILDEATSSLDSESEKSVQVALKNVMKNRTSIVIAHRLSTISNVDKIIVMEKGKIIESGTHKELLNTNSNYKKLVEIQSF
ncbi:MAG: ABC transporter ATP-binding protein [Flavobacteriaceae bacterium]